MQLFNELFGNVLNFTWQQGVMIVKATGQQ